MILRNFYAGLHAYLTGGVLSNSVVNLAGDVKSINEGFAGGLCQLGNAPTGSNTTWANIAFIISSFTSYAGIALGTGTTPPTYEDYKLSGEQITTFSYTRQYINRQEVDGMMEVSARFTVVNTGTKAFTIGETALIGQCASGTSAANKVMIERTVLDNPITIEPNGAGQVTCTYRVKIPDEFKLA